MRFMLAVAEIGVPLLRNSSSRGLALCVCGSWLAPVFLDLGRSSVSPVLPLRFITLHGFWYCWLNFKPLIGVKCKGVKCRVTCFKSLHLQAFVMLWRSCLERLARLKNGT